MHLKGVPLRSFRAHVLLQRRFFGPSDRNEGPLIILGDSRVSIDYVFLPNEFHTLSSDIFVEL